MKMIYISHPFTGNEEENLKRSEELREMMQRRNPDKVFINPLVMLGGCKHKRAYCWELAAALEILSRCDAVTFAEGWQDSTGCKAERAFALRVGMTITPMDYFMEKPIRE